MSVDDDTDLELTSDTSPTAPHAPLAPLAATPRITETKTAIFAPGSLADPLHRGALVGEYAIEREVGHGGMGVVYSAAHPMIGKRAAIKVLRSEICRDPIAIDRFIDEARAVNQIGHPNIVDIFSFGQLPDGRSYFVMEWLSGESLGDRIRRGGFALGEACELLAQLARALAAAHAKGIVHRDLKPDNVFLVEVPGDQPRVKLLDFGIAKLLARDPGFERTKNGAVVGTPKYLSPEQARGIPVDHRADIYSLGGIAFEMLTGRPVFVATSPFEVITMHLQDLPDRALTLAPHLPLELDDVVAAMLAKDPARRPTLEQVRAIVDRIVKRESLRGYVPTGPYRAAPVTSALVALRRRWRVAALIGGAMVFGIAFAIAMARRGEPVREPPASLAPAVTPRAEPPAPPPPVVEPAPAAAPPAPVPALVPAPEPAPPQAEPELPAVDVRSVPPPAPAKRDRPPPTRKRERPAKPAADASGGELLVPGTVPRGGAR